MNNVNFGVFLPFYSYCNQPNNASLFSNLKATVQECERLGYHSIWLDDHLMYGKAPILEGWTTLSAIAAATTTIRLGTMVTCSGFRNPALMAKMAATVDVISDGRLEFGLGAGIQMQEHQAYGYSFPKPSVRVQWLQESVEIIKSLWTHEKTTYKGKHYTTTDAACEPKPLQKPHPPIIIAGTGEKYLLKVTAQHADRLDFSYVPTLEAYRHKLDVLAKHCQTARRDFDKIERSCWPEGQIILGQDKAVLEEKVNRLKPRGVSREVFEKTHFVGTPEQLKTKLKPYLDLGVTHFMLFFADLPDLGSLRLFAKAI